MANQETSTALLILPSLSWPLKKASLASAFGVTLRTLFQKLGTKSTDSRAVQRLDIAVVLSEVLSTHLAIARDLQFPSILQLLEEYYRLTCIAAAQESVDLDFPGGIDVRIFILQRAVGTWDGKQTLSGPLIDLQTFAASSLSYTNFYAAESEEGGRALDAVVKTLRAKNKAVPSIERLPCGLSISTPSSETNNSLLNPPRHYSVAVGGTFDHLHIGHKLLLSATVFLAQPTYPDIPPRPSQPRLITVGITGDELLVNKKYASQVESWDSRQAAIAAFVESILVFHPDPASIRTVEHISNPGPNGHVVRVSYAGQCTINYTKISDPFGPTITDEGISALVISKETRAGGKAVNDKRAEKGWKGLEVFEVDVLDAGVGNEEGEKEGAVEKETFEAKISSTEMRRRLDALNKA